MSGHENLHILQQDRQLRGEDEWVVVDLQDIGQLRLSVNVHGQSE